MSTSHTKIAWTDRLRERFWSYVRRADGDACWEWTAGRFADGMRYGQLRAGPRKLKAHRAAFELTRGEIPDGMKVLHRCDNPICCNPEHLFLGTNTADMIAKGRSRLVPGTSLPGARNPAAKLRPEHVAEIRAAVAAGERRAVIAERFGICVTQVGNVVRGDCWRSP